MNENKKEIVAHINSGSFPLFGFVPWLIEEKAKLDEFTLKKHVLPENPKVASITQIIRSIENEQKREFEM